MQEAKYDVKLLLQFCRNDFTACFSRCNFARTILWPVFLVAILRERFYDLFFSLQFCRKLFHLYNLSRNFATLVFYAFILFVMFQGLLEYLFHIVAKAIRLYHFHIIAVRQKLLAEIVGDLQFIGEDGKVGVRHLLFL